MDNTEFPKFSIEHFVFVIEMFEKTVLVIDSNSCEFREDLSQVPFRFWIVIKTHNVSDPV